MNPPSSLEKKGVGVLWVGVRGGGGCLAGAELDAL